MALTEIKTSGIADDAVTTDKLANAINTARDANTAKATNATHSGDVTGSGSLTIADNAVTLAKMAGGTDGQIITYDASGDPVAVGPGTDGQVLTSTGAGSPPAFEAIPAQTPEGTAVLSTGESGGTKFLREDGDGTSSWQSVPAAGAALTGSTNNTITTVTGANAIQGEANLTFDGTKLNVNGGTSNNVLHLESTDGTCSMEFYDNATTNGNQPIVGGIGNNFYVETGGSERVRVDSSGAVTKPSQPSASAYLSGTDAGGNGGKISNDYAIASSTRWNIGSHYSTSTGKFTCPVAGKYVVTFNSNMSLSNLSVGDNYNIQVRKNGSAVQFNYDTIYNTSWQHIGFTNIIDCAANDYLQLFYASSGNKTFGCDNVITWNQIFFYLLH